MSNETTTPEGFSSGLQKDLTQEFGDDAKGATVATDAVTGKSTLFSDQGSTLGEIDTGEKNEFPELFGTSETNTD